MNAQDIVDDHEFDEGCHRGEHAMDMKEDNEHIDWPGYCADWDSTVHAAQYMNVCNVCQNIFQDGEEFLELPCTDVEHTDCIEADS